MYLLPFFHLQPNNTENSDLRQEKLFNSTEMVQNEQMSDF